ncbi:MAG: NAD(P)H-dependent oxidoreductase [Cohaesibacteraceae bacterium]|nr:NAD(P)H-dependent oxidoreductase [Cohaesibacteraceae bacterium]
MASILIQFAHPALQKSRVNSALLEAANGLDKVTVCDLYELYPNFLIDVELEQAKLSSHDIIIFQCPMYWYSVPALVKEWFELVLERGFAYGEGAHLLTGKKVMLAASFGGMEADYLGDPPNVIPLDQLISPIRQTMQFCKFNWLPPFVTFDADRADASRMTSLDAVYRYILVGLRDNAFGMDALNPLVPINHQLTLQVN